MPSLQVVDLNPRPRNRELTPLEKTLSGFSQRHRENQLQQQEGDALSDIYTQYQSDGENLQSKLEAIQKDPRLSPTTRVNTIDQLLKFSEYNKGLQADAQKKMEKERVRQASLKAGIDPDLPSDLQKVQYENQLVDKRLNSILRPDQNSQDQLIESDVSEVVTPENKLGKTKPQGFQALSDEELIALRGVKGVSEQVKGEQERRKVERELDQRNEDLKRKTFESDRAFHSKRADPILERNEKFKETLPLLESNLRAIQDSAPELTTMDYIADRLNFEPFRSAKGSQLKAATKDYLIKTIQSIGGRPNQWIEQQIESALTKAGKSPEANLTVAEMLQYNLDVEKKKSQLIDQFAEEDMQSHGFVKSDILSRANAALPDYVKEREAKMAYNLREIYEMEDPTRIEDMNKVREGTPLTFQKAKFLDEKFGEKAEQVAKHLGYTIPPAEYYQER